MTNGEYWAERAKIAEAAAFKKCSDYLKSLKTEYDKAIAAVERDINTWYGRFAENNSVSFAQAQKMLDKRELKELKWTVEEYIEKGRENAQNQKWIKELENASARVHISRLEALKLQMRNHVESLMSSEYTGMNKTLTDVYSDSYYQGVYGFEQTVGVATTFIRLDTAAIERVLLKPWAADGLVFSERIWGTQRPRLVNELYTLLTQATIRGENPKTLTKSIEHSFGVTRRQAETLCLTEGAHFRALGQRDAYKEFGTDEYQIDATLDSKTCSHCGDMDGKHFAVGKWETGITAPPFHPRCRCATVPYIDDEFTVDETRIARDPETGRYSMVDGDMTYSDWVASMSDEKRAALDLAKKKDSRRTADKLQYARYKTVLGTKNVPKSFDKFQVMKYTGGEEWERLKDFYRYKLNNPQADRNAYNCVKEMRSVGIKGSIHIPKRDDIDITKLAFDDAHINGQRKHGVTEKEAKEYINTALVSITKRKGITENYFSKTGAAYVNPTENVIKTAYSKDEFKGETLIIMEVLRKYGY